jgi:hypothetical protein
MDLLHFNEAASYQEAGTLAEAGAHISSSSGTRSTGLCHVIITISRVAAATISMRLHCIGKPAHLQKLEPNFLEQHAVDGALPRHNHDIKGSCSNHFDEAASYREAGKLAEAGAHISSSSGKRSTVLCHVIITISRVAAATILIGFPLLEAFCRVIIRNFINIPRPIQ